MNLFWLSFVRLGADKRRVGRPGGKEVAVKRRRKSLPNLLLQFSRQDVHARGGEPIYAPLAKAVVVETGSIVTEGLCVHVTDILRS